MKNLEPPRWPGGPGICPASNLLAYESSAAGKAHMESLGGHLATLAAWECRECDGWHLLTGSVIKSGDDMASPLKLTPEWQELIRRTQKPVEFGRV